MVVLLECPKCSYRYAETVLLRHSFIKCPSCKYEGMMTTFAERRKETTRLSCIFDTQPMPMCSVCIDVGKLQCLLNRRAYKVSEKGKEELKEVLVEVINSPGRVK